MKTKTANNEYSSPQLQKIILSCDDNQKCFECESQLITFALLIFPFSYAHHVLHFIINTYLLISATYVHYLLTVSPKNKYTIPSMRW